MDTRFTLRNGIVSFSFNDNSGSVFYDADSGDILSLPLVCSSLASNVLSAPHHDVSIEHLSRRGWIIVEDA